MLLHTVGIVCALTFFGVYVVHCHARHGMDHGQWAKAKSIMCYECNSEYDPRCGDPFDPYTIGIVNCSKKRPLEYIDYKPTLCRKTVQKVQGKIRVIRGCGYIPGTYDDRKECLKRSGTHEVNVRYCSCKNNLCNSGRQTTATSATLLGTLIIMAITRRFIQTG